MIKERPILFSGAMVRAIQDGQKTQTRRIVKPKPGWPIDFVGGGPVGGPDWNDPSCWGFEDPDTTIWWLLKSDGDGSQQIPSPYGQAGDRLWVRESTRARYLQNCLTGEPTNALCAEYVADGKPVLNADGFDLAWWYSKNGCPSIHMPRGACRIVLDVTDVRAERLQEISEADAEAEGVDFLRRVPGADETWTARELFKILWVAINGEVSWEANPWVWVVDFRRVPA